VRTGVPSVVSVRVCREPTLGIPRTWRNAESASETPHRPQTNIWRRLQVSLLTLSNLDSPFDGNTYGAYFQPPAVDLSSYAGTTIQLVFHVTTDGAMVTSFLIDDVSVNAL
jgi:hypothetical protein